MERGVKIQRIDISIHAPRGGSDANDPGAGFANENFNPRSPWGERPRSAGANQ